MTLIDRRHVGMVLPPFTVEVEKGRLRCFASAIGETNPVYSDETAARAAGYPSLLVPPTFLFALEFEKPSPFDFLELMGVSVSRTLHGEQFFKYHALVFAGQVLTFCQRITDIYAKKNGALEFIVKDTAVTNDSGILVAELHSVGVVRNE